MSLAFFCPSCGDEVIVGFLHEGDPARCMVCGSHVTVPANARTSARRPPGELPRPRLPRRLEELDVRDAEPLRTFSPVELVESANFTMLGELLVFPRGVVGLFSQRLPTERDEVPEKEGFRASSWLMSVPTDERAGAVRRVAELRREQRGMSLSRRLLSLSKAGQFLLVERDAVEEVSLDAGTDSLVVGYTARVVPGKPAGRFELALRCEEAPAMAAYLKEWLATPCA